MSEGVLLGFFIVLAGLALGFIAFPLRTSKFALFTLLPISIIAIVCLYSNLGGLKELSTYQQQLEKSKLAKTLLSKVKSTDELITKLKVSLQANPNSARGWYLLGRLYVHQNRWKDAEEVLAKARKLNPESERYTINYIYSLWELEGRKFSQQSLTLLKDVLAKNPNQPDALGLLAKEAFDRKDYPEAKNYWRRLLKLTPENSEAARNLQRALASV